MLQVIHVHVPFETRIKLSIVTTKETNSADTKFFVGYGHYSKLATPFCYSRMCITMGAAGACTSYPI